MPHGDVMILAVSRWRRRHGWVARGGSRWSSSFRRSPSGATTCGGAIATGSA